MIDLLFSLTGDSLAEWVNEQVRVHREAQQKDNSLLLDPAVHEAFQRSTAASGKCFNPTWLNNTLCFLLQWPRAKECTCSNLVPNAEEPSWRSNKKEKKSDGSEKAWTTGLNRLQSFRPGLLRLRRRNETTTQPQRSATDGERKAESDLALKEASKSSKSLRDSLLPLLRSIQTIQTLLSTDQQYQLAGIQLRAR